MSTKASVHVCGADCLLSARCSRCRWATTWWTCRWGRQRTKKAFGQVALLQLSTVRLLQTRQTRINMVDLPLGATEDRVCGTIDIEKALTEGVKAFEPGLLVSWILLSWHYVQSSLHQCFHRH